MAWGNKKPKKKCYCAFCGKEIKWVRGKAESGEKAKTIPVEPRNVYFLPSPGGKSFISPDGNVRTGRESSDGLLGFHRHDCPVGPSRKALSEKELKARQWA